MDYGPYEGTDLTHLSPELLTFFSDFIHNPAPEGMEQLSSVIGRAGAFLEDIRQLRGKYPDFNARNCDERSAGISDPGVTGQVLVKVHWELCDLFCGE